jgi:histidyl-tRNA synthetase
MRSQMKAADRSGAQVAVIIGSDELAAGTAVVRPLRAGEHHDQHVVRRTDLLESVQKVLA